MSAPKAKATPDAKGHASEEGAKPKGSNKLVIGIFVSAIIIAETGVFFFMVPSGEDITLRAEAKLLESVREQASKAKAEEAAGGGGHGGGHGGGGKAAEKDGETTEEFDFQKPISTPFTPLGEARPHRVECQLFGTVKHKNMDKLKELWAERKLRILSSITLEIRNSSMQELTENGLGLIQRRILRTTNDLLGEEIFLSVKFSEYQVVEEP